MRVGVDAFNIPQTHAEMIMTNDKRPFVLLILQHQHLVFGG